jgi:hypothetical protein
MVEVLPVGGGAGAEAVVVPQAVAVAVTASAQQRTAALPESETQFLRREVPPPAPITVMCSPAAQCPASPVHTIARSWLHPVPRVSSASSSSTVHIRAPAFAQIVCACTQPMASVPVAPAAP